MRFGGLQVAREHHEPLSGVHGLHHLRGRRIERVFLLEMLLVAEVVGLVLREYISLMTRVYISIEFRRAQLNLLNANLEYNSAKYQTKLSEAFFLKICGEILNYDY